MKNNAGTVPCELIFHPTQEQYTNVHIRQFQGCPTLAITRGGRIYIAWYSGGTREPHMDNFNVLHYSDDLGKTWSEPLLVIPSSKERCVHALDIQLWTAPNGSLYLFWVQNNTHKVGEGPDGKTVDGYVFDDYTHAEWAIICENPDADEPVFSAPRCLDTGFLRCKPLVLPNGRWINFNYDQITDRYGYSISDDEGQTYHRKYGGKKIETSFDESMAYQKQDGSIRMLARTRMGQLAESYSFDKGETWTDAVPSGINSPNTRFFIARTPSGRVLMINNDDDKLRQKMTLYLSDDDGSTWPYRLCLDPRNDLSYPDADFYNGKIYLTYDHHRVGDKEILFAVFTEEDIIAGNTIVPTVVSKP